MRRVFVDSEHWQLVTTNAVVFETYGVLLIRSRDKRRAAMLFLDLVATGTCTIRQGRACARGN